MIYKLYVLVSLEALAKMKGNRGKLVAQAGHAFLHAWWDAINRFPAAAEAYRTSDHAFKITLAVPSQIELEQFYDAYHPQCGVSLVKDAAFTVFDEPTVTCLGIGPINQDQIGADLKGLKVLI